MTHRSVPCRQRSFYDSILSPFNVGKMDKSLVTGSLCGTTRVVGLGLDGYLSIPNLYSDGRVVISHPDGE